MRAVRGGAGWAGGAGAALCVESSLRALGVVADGGGEGAGWARRLAGRRFFVFALAAAVFLADFVSKEWALAALRGARAIEVAPFLRLVYVENTGVAFGMMAGGGEAGRWLLLALALALCAGLVWWLRASECAAERAAGALLLGGALGNVADRARHGFVVDFVDVFVGEYHWPAFNVADAAICVGGFWLAALLWKSGR